MIGYKVLTYDYCSPLQGGKAVWNGEIGAVLPRVQLDRSAAECAPGWHFCRLPETALRIAGLWPNGYPSVLLRVEPIGDYVERGNKMRSESLGILAICSERTIRQAIMRLSTPFGEHAAQMTRSQMAWRRALARPLRDSARVERELRAALAIRDLDAWTLQRYDDTRAAWDARDARAARAARAALIYETAVRMGQLSGDPNPMLLTTGLREAYRYGLAVAVPIAPAGTLGWAMV